MMLLVRSLLFICVVFFPVSMVVGAIIFGCQTNENTDATSVIQLSTISGGTDSTVVHFLIQQWCM